MKKYIVPASINMIFALSIWAGQSIVGLLLLFSLLLVMCGLALHVVYRAVNDQKVEAKVHTNYEEVSPSTVKEIFTFIYSGFVALDNTVAQLVAISEPAKTLAFVVVVHVTFAWIWLFNASDMAVMCLIYNFYTGGPLVWPKIEPFVSRIALKTPYLNKLS
jgi:heme/copper-type cytochrome/quinol oxidase subunit 2